MTDVDEEQDHLIRLLSPDRARPAGAPGPPVTELLRDILRTPATAVPRRRRLLVAVPVVAGLAAAALVVSALLPASAPVAVGPAPAHAALTFTEDGGFLIVTINDPAADPQRYRDELAKHGLNIKIELVPAEPGGRRQGRLRGARRHRRRPDPGADRGPRTVHRQRRPARSGSRCR